MDTVPFQHAVGIHDPTHHSRVGSYVRRRDVLLRSDQWSDGSCISSCDRADFVFGKLGRIAYNTALTAAVRDIYNGTFESHPGGKRTDFVRAYVWMETDSAFCRSAGSGMLDSVALEYVGRSVVHPNRNGDFEFSFRILNGFDIAVAVAKNISGLLYYLEYVVIRIVRLIHNVSPSFLIVLFRLDSQLVFNIGKFHTEY